LLYFCGDAVPSMLKRLTSKLTPCSCCCAATLWEARFGDYKDTIEVPEDLKPLYDICKKGVPGAYTYLSKHPELVKVKKRKGKKGAAEGQPGELGLVSTFQALPSVSCDSLTVSHPLGLLSHICEWLARAL
jgi:hypothetical protein